jgi:hypothetical protein
MALKGRPKASLSDLSKIKLIPDNLDAFIDELNSENDRACALVCAAALDAELGNVLATKFIKLDAEDYDRIFYSSSGSLSSFSYKIQVAYALSIIDKSEMKELTSIRHIRNAFAHSVAPLSFAETLIERECNQLRFATADLGSSIRTNISIARKKFIGSVMFFLVKFGEIHLSTEKNRLRLIKIEAFKIKLKMRIARIILGLVSLRCINRTFAKKVVSALSLRASLDKFNKLS